MEIFDNLFLFVIIILKEVDRMQIERKTILKDEKFLRQISKEVDLTNDDYKEVIKLLHDYCIENNNKTLAIASVQLGIPLRLVYLRNTSLEEIFNSERDESKILINPKVLRREGITRYWEACASCLDYFGLVERPYRIDVEYYDEFGEKHKDIFEEFAAIVLSHELDHLDGTLHIDKSIELYDMPLEERKEFRKTHTMEIIKKDGEFKQTTTNFKKIEDIK